MVGSGHFFAPLALRFTARPNGDTLYSAMYFDVSTEPMVLSVLDSGGRNHLLPMLDMWSGVFCGA